MVLSIFEMIATSGFLTALECTKFVFGRGFAGTTQGELIAGLRGLTSKEKGRGGTRKRDRKGTGGTALLWQIPGSALLM